ncbi:flagellar basal body-associated FliL family protein [Magnetospirillum moscoviense]|uniref:Flagellar protein FliL n=1 Tax=Magnetospirillum moscoviense TaxID=1437059 RepID=A0A178MBQ6_9PROT|nr:flagellar basal body-associated FliL family protein [Magnetospirillum moscoviense]MBF0327449.1 flagellar basal body-associated FliL family protein [Alphaproteobacteria bacterium]OAN46230.1 flagellar basal body protein FliL [Magnetospirillum moscoviense]
MAEDLEEDFDEGEGSDDSSDSPKRKLPIKKILIIVLPILLLVGIGAGLYFTGIIDKLLGKGEPAAEKSEAPKDAPKVVGPAVFMDLPEMLVNLQTQGRKQAFLKIKVAIELESVLDQPKVEAVQVRLIDTFQVYLRELRPEDLQGAAGMHLLREELLTRIQAVVKPVKVNDVLFKEMLVQ